jgi:hypothetical protein
MTAEKDERGDGEIKPFPFSRVRPSQTSASTGDVVYGAMAKTLGIPHEQTTGHWCSRCDKIWYGYLLEVACPLCGNRHG